AMISVLTLIVGAIVHFFERQAGNDHLAWVVAGLAVFMVLAMWLFPETGRKNGSKS
ncbi:MAG: hypothetical protein IIC55_01840, partial [Proteobacteria bacterium]|nr:hypothetical protein [Pseudomonadota bacterium]